MKYAGIDHLIIGSDHGHNDPAEQTHLQTPMRAREDVTPSLVEKILSDNARKFYRI